MCYSWNIDRHVKYVRFVKYWEVKRDLFCQIRCAIWYIFCEIFCEIFTRNILCYLYHIFCIIFCEIFCDMLLCIISINSLCYIFSEYFTYLTYFTYRPNVSIIAHISKWQYFTLYFTAPVCRCRTVGLPVLRSRFSRTRRPGECQWQARAQSHWHGPDGRAARRARPCHRRRRHGRAAVTILVSRRAWVTGTGTVADAAAARPAAAADDPMIAAGPGPGPGPSHWHRRRRRSMLFESHFKSSFGNCKRCKLNSAF